jgi:hypothetical protein
MVLRAVSLHRQPDAHRRRELPALVSFGVAVSILGVTML